MRRLLAVLTLGLAGLVIPSAGADTSPPTPTVSDPPSGIHGHPLWDSWYQLGPFGYTEREFFLSGVAADGEGATAPYTTRIVVTRPIAPAKFNGTVLLDWVNVTAQFENAVDTMEAREMLMREGFAYVHVSAQAAGVCCTPLTPKVWDPVRYAALNHPGDDFANDIFTQVARAIRTPKPGIKPLGILDAQVVLAAGQSQSASKLYNYVSTTQATAQAIDGFLIHGGGGKSFDAPLAAPVLHLLSDSEADPEGPSADPKYRLWEVAGTAHSDFFIGYQSVVGLGPRVTADAPQVPKKRYDAIMNTAGNYGAEVHPMLATCVLAGSTMPMHYAASSAIYQLDRWVKTGIAPKHGPRFAFDGEALATGAFGNTRGGIRLAPIDVPVARYKSTACPLGGLTIPMSRVQIQQLYPTHAIYYAKMRAATDRNVREGWLLRADAIDLMRRACAAQGRWQPVTTTACPTYVPPAWNVA